MAELVTMEFSDAILVQPSTNVLDDLHAHVKETEREPFKQVAYSVTEMMCDILTRYYEFDAHPVKDTGLIEISGFDGEYWSDYWLQRSVFEVLAPYVQNVCEVDVLLEHERIPMRFAFRDGTVTRMQGRIVYEPAVTAAAPSYSQARRTVADRVHLAQAWFKARGFEAAPEANHKHASSPLYIGTFKIPTTEEQRLVVLLDSLLLTNSDHPPQKYHSLEQLCELLNEYIGNPPGEFWETAIL